jgi:hypothetical protein
MLEMYGGWSQAKYFFAGEISRKWVRVVVCCMKVYNALLYEKRLMRYHTTMWRCFKDNRS